MFCTRKDKAPGPDGYNSHFFKITWHIIGKDVVAAIMDYFEKGYLLPTFNSTTLALV